MRFFSSLILKAFSLGVASMLISCGGNDQADVNVNSIEEYAKVRQLANVCQNRESDVTNAYFDFSCISYATDMGYKKDPDKTKNRELFDALLKHITSGIYKYDFFRVDNGGVSKIDNEGTTALYQCIKTAPTNDKTKIVSALEDIVKKGIPAVYVTDFEGYDGNVFDQSAFAAKYFANWIEAGNKITFVGADYSEYMNTGKVDKWMYITIFDYVDGTLTKKIMESIKDQKYKIFTMSNSFSVETDYANAQKGGDYHDKNGDPLVCGTQEDGSDVAFKKYDKMDAEFYPFTVKWDEMKKTADELSQYGEPKYRNFLSNLILNQEDFVCGYRIKSLAVEVKDVQKDFDEYFACTVDAEGNEKAKHGQAAISQVTDLFQVDRCQFLNSSNSSNIAVNLADKFVGGTPIGMTDEHDLLCATVKIDKAEVNFNNKIFRRSDGNNSLEQSVKEALTSCLPEGKVVYTYFMKVY